MLLGSAWQYFFSHWVLGRFGFVCAVPFGGWFFLCRCNVKNDQVKTKHPSPAKNSSIGLSVGSADIYAFYLIHRSPSLIFCLITPLPPVTARKSPQSSRSSLRGLRTAVENLLPQDCSVVFSSACHYSTVRSTLDHTILDNPHVLAFLCNDPFQISQVLRERLHLPVVELFGLRRGLLHIVSSPDINEDVFGVGESPRHVQGCCKGYQDRFTFSCHVRIIPSCARRREEFLTRLETSFYGVDAFSEFILGLAQFLERSGEMLQFIVELFFDGGEVVDRERRQVDYGVGGSAV